MAKLSRDAKVQMGYKRFKTPQEMEKISEAYYYDILISSGELKKLIMMRIYELNVDLNLVLKEAGIAPSTFRTKYLKQVDPVSTKTLRQSHMIRLLEVLGIKARVVFAVEKNIDNVRTDHLRYKTKKDGE